MTRAWRFALIATLGIVVLAAALLPQPRRAVVDGREVVEFILFGHAVRPWQSAIIAFVMVGLVHTGIDRLLRRFWPEEPESDATPMPITRPESEWREQAPNPRIPAVALRGRLWTPTEYLIAEEPWPNPFLNGDTPEDHAAEVRAHYAEFERWLKEAPEDMLRELIPSARKMDRSWADELAHRLIDAHEERGIPFLDELARFAEEIDDELRAYVFRIGNGSPRWGG